jgi:succinate-semialdehyde dehydrogenase/glutarate-semialdehyde dehydrogenase
MIDVQAFERKGVMHEGLFIGGEWITTGKTFDVVDPATEEVFAKVADATAAEAVRALDAAATAQASWAATPPRDRGEILRRAFELMIERTEELARLTTLEMGRTLAESRGDVTYGAEFLRWFSEEAVRIGGEYRVAPTGDYRILTTRQPIGPSYLVTPWNFPLSMVTRKAGAALAAGCTMVIKPAEATPLSCLELADIFTEAGVPAGVLNVITSFNPAEVTDALINDGRLRMLSFTGSTPVGKKLMEQAAGKVIRTTMELGGNAPFLVFPDADLDAAVAGAVQAKMRNAAESCIAANRFIVHEAVADEFATRLAAELGTMPIGSGLDPETKVGPLIDARAIKRVSELVADATERGAKVLLGGEVPDRPGYFYPPTVIIGVSPDALICHREIFGPVAAIVSYASEEEMIAAANATEFGLAAYAFTRDLARALRVSEAIEAGIVGINRGLVSNPAAPFGGVKESGIGREGGFEGIEDYLEVKYVALGL